MEPMKNLCGLIPESLHKRLMENKDPEMTNGEYLTKVLTAYLDQPATPRQEQRTLAVQISEEMFPAVEVVFGCPFTAHPKGICPEPSESGVGPVGTG